MKLSVLILLFVAVQDVHAAFQRIWQGFISSGPNQIIELDKKITEANYNFQIEKFDWKLDLKGAIESANLASLVSFQAQKTTTNSLSLTFSKQSYKYGEFSFGHNQLVYDLSEWTNKSFLPTDADTLYEVKNILSYNYEFLDKSRDMDFVLVSLTQQQSRFKNAYEQQKLYLDFYKAYIQAKLDIYNVRLTKEFLARAQKRVDIISRRIKDGLSRSVELLHAKASLLQQQENLNTARVSLKNNLAVLENILEMKLEEAFFSEVKWEKKEVTYWSSSFESSKNFQLSYLEKTLEKSEMELERLDNQNGMKLNLGAKYITNAVTDESSESFKDASGIGDNKSQVLSLTLTIPLGSDKGDALKETILLNKRRNSLELEKSRDDINIQREALKDQLNYLDTAHEFAKDKIQITMQTEKEQNKLYLRGQASFEEVIRSEEAFVAAKLSEKKMLAQYEVLLGQYAFLHNGMEKFLNLYVD